MSQFLENAQRIFETAGAVHENGGGTDYAILIDSSGAVQMIANCDWALDSLRAERGARAAYKISDANGQVRVEGWSGHQRCLFESERPASVARRLLADRPRYLLTTPLLLGT